jgi:hypothetical protein
MTCHQKWHSHIALYLLVMACRQKWHSHIALYPFSDGLSSEMAQPHCFISV